MIKILKYNGVEYDYPAGWTEACNGYIKLSSDAEGTLALDVQDNVISINTAVTAASMASAWSTKLGYAISGGMPTGITFKGPDNSDYYFDEGIDKYISDASGNKFVISVNHVRPNSDRDLIILSSPCVGIYSDTLIPNTVIINDTCKSCIPCEDYAELIAYTWVLYHAVNYILHEIFSFIPEQGVFGTFLSYQAFLAKWNHFVWSDSYIQDIGLEGISTSLMVGFKSAACNNNITEIRSKIRIINSRSEHIEANASETWDGYLQLVYNGTLTNLPNSTDASWIITRNCSNGSSVQESGLGTEIVLPNLISYDVVIQFTKTDPAVSSTFLQESYYVLCLALVISNKADVYLEPISSSQKSDLEINTAWLTNGDTVVNSNTIQKTTAFKLLAVKKYVESAE